MGWLFGDEERIDPARRMRVQIELDQIFNQAAKELDELQGEEKAIVSKISVLSEALNQLRQAEDRFYLAPTPAALEELRHALQFYKISLAEYNKKRASEEHWFKHFKRHADKVEKYIAEVQRKQGNG